MQVKITKHSDTSLTAVVSAGTDELDPIKQEVLQQLNTADLKIPGFRDGKAPLKLVEKHADQKRLQVEFLDAAVNHLYVAAAKQEDFRPVMRPEISLKKFVPFSELEFEAKVDVLGSVKLPDYTKIKKARSKVSVSTKDITAVLNDLKVRAGDKKEVNRAAKAGDQVTIDFKGVDEKSQPVAGADGKDYPLLLGSNTFIPGFEDNILGLKPGEDKTFTLKFPEDYGVKALARKKVTFDVSIKKVEEVEEPELDDAFAAKVGPFKTMAELKDDIKKQLLNEKQQQAEREYENALIKEIVQKAKLEVPDALVEDLINRMEQEEKQNLMYRGQTWEEHLKEEGVTPEEHREKKRPEAKERVMTGLVLSEIADQEKLEVTPEELEIRIQLMKGQYQDQQAQEQLDQPENRREIASRMLAEKTVEKLKSYAAG